MKAAQSWGSWGGQTASPINSPSPNFPDEVATLLPLQWLG